MSPGFAADNSINGRFSNPVFAREGAMRDSAGGVAFADGVDLFFGKFGESIMLAASKPLRMLAKMMVIATRKTFRMRVRTIRLAGRGPSFSDPVSQVFIRGRGEEMTRIHADRVVALMADPEALGNQAVEDGPGDARSAKQLVYKVENPVASCSVGALPGPAIIRATDSDLLPETKNVLRTKGRDATNGPSHGGLLCRPFWSGRSTVHAAGRPLFMGQYSRQTEPSQVKKEARHGGQAA